ncbi:MAG TPA: hypothetical protein DEQ14_05930, partial [Treponema sp.]|nr:hypothetical protein [Treponema sp.]
FFGDKDVNAKVEAIQNALDEQTVTIGENGEIEADNIIAGDDYRVTIEGHEFIVTPQTDGDNVGTLTLTDGVNIKTSLVPWSSSVDMMRLYSGESYDMILRFTNIGEDICRAMEYELTLPEGIEVTEIGDSILASILPGTTREVELTIRCGMISDAFEFKTIEINTVDIDGKTWQDSVSVRVNKEP